MPLLMKSLRVACLSVACLTILAGLPVLVVAQEVVTTENMVDKLSGLETAPELDLPGLRQKAAARLKSRVDAAPLKRPPVAPELVKLPHFDVALQFNPDSSIIRPESYQVLGRIADAFYDPKLLSYGFLIVGHTESAGRRDNNLALSQKRADAIRDILVNTFKVSPKRLQAIGLGEEQLQDSAHPAAPVNQQITVIAVLKMP
jgi:OOP family OmpA-OmpF porin